MGKKDLPKEQLLDVRELRTCFYSREGTLKAVDGVSFSVEAGETLGIAGESGCGKSVTAQSILRVVPANGGIEHGEIIFNSNSGPVDLVKLDAASKELKAIRGKAISMVFQEPMTSFSLSYTIGNQIMEVFRLHQDLTKQEARKRAIEMLGRVGMPNPEQTIDAYPFNLSGGMRQRAMIAMALACRPKLLIADEPTTAVDVTIQAQILRLIKELQSDFDMSLIIITHDLAVIAQLADKVMIMYLGKDVETAPVNELFANPFHPYTRGLLSSIPKLGHGNEQRLDPIPGSVPNVYEIPTGCPFHPRCPNFMADLCDKEEPPVYKVGANQFARCFLYRKEES